MIRLYLFLVSLLLSFTLWGGNPSATEIRAVWLTTNWNLDWPRTGLSAEGQKQQLRDILDKLQAANFNTVFFQSRIRGDVFYKSNIEPWSPFLQGKTQYDPLQFAIEECHKRGMECHAWLVTFPVGTPQQVKKHGKSSIALRRPDLCKLYKGEWYLDPGNPDARAYIVQLVEELVRKYNIDGVHFDYIRYPDPAAKFPDANTFRKYSRGKNLKDWRLSNITELVDNIYDKVKSIKPWVQVSCSPLGRYRSLDAMHGTWTAYESVHQDAGLWMRSGKMDAVYPMLYYKDTEFGKYVQDWLSNSKGRFVVPGLGAYRMLSGEGNWSLGDITEQIDYSENSDAAGVAYFRAGNVLDNTKGIFNTLKDNYYEYPAKLPPMKWLDNVAPNSPLNVQVSRNKDGLIAIEWESSNPEEDQTYTIYESLSEETDTSLAKTIVMTGIHGNKLYLDTPGSEEGVYFSVTASDRFHNESVPSFPVYFILSTTLRK